MPLTFLTDEGDQWRGPMSFLFLRRVNGRLSMPLRVLVVGFRVKSLVPSVLVVGFGRFRVIWVLYLGIRSRDPYYKDAAV